MSSCRSDAPLHVERYLLFTDDSEFSFDVLKHLMEMNLELPGPKPCEILFTVYEGAIVIPESVEAIACVENFFRKLAEDNTHAKKQSRSQALVNLKLRAAQICPRRVFWITQSRFRLELERLVPRLFHRVLESFRIPLNFSMLATV